jgi:hypothetical protein
VWVAFNRIMIGFIGMIFASTPMNHYIDKSRTFLEWLNASVYLEKNVIQDCNA